MSQNFNKLSIVSLIIALLSFLPILSRFGLTPIFLANLLLSYFGILGILLAIGSIIQIKKRSERGIWLAVIALIINIIASYPALLFLTV